MKDQLFFSHGTLMVFGWLFWVACAILFARYFKSMLPGRQSCQLDYWFQLHRGFNILGILCIATGFICIFVVEKGLWIGLGEKEWGPNVKHAILGMTASIGAFIQPILALFRCGKYSPRRPIFNWVHRIVGIGSWVCASAAIWMTTEFWSSFQTNGKYGKAPKGLLIFYWVVLGVVIIGLEVWITITERMKSRGTSSGDAQQLRGLHEKSQPPYGTFTGKANETVTMIKTSHPIKYEFIRTLLLLFFVLMAIGVTVTLVCFIALP